MSRHPLARASRIGTWNAVETAAGGEWRAWALRLEGNPLDPSWDRDVLEPAIAAAAPAGLRLVAWSGTFASEPFAGDMRNWMRPGWDALQARLDAWRAPLADAGVRLALHPHATHLLSDVAGAMRLLVQRPQEPFDVLLAPADLLTATMLGDGAREAGRARLPESQDVREHLARAFSALGPRTPLCVIGDVRTHGASGESDGCGLEACPLGKGLLPIGVLRDLLVAHVPAEVPVLTHGDASLLTAAS